MALLGPEKAPFPAIFSWRSPVGARQQDEAGRGWHHGPKPCRAGVAEIGSKWHFPACMTRRDSRDACHGKTRTRETAFLSTRNFHRRMLQMKFDYRPEPDLIQGPQVRRGPESIADREVMSAGWY
jgi:hypothetical protein